MMLRRIPKVGTYLLLLFFSFALFQATTDSTYGAPHHQSPAFDCASVAEIPDAECNALVALYTATDGPNWTNNDGWLQDDTPCDWEGIGCSNGRLHQLFLEGNGLTGSLPPELGNLTELTWLQLNGNQLNGPIPSSLGNLAQVTWLRLEDNQLSGTIPAELGNMTALENLYLAGNPLSGAIPAQLGDLVNLKKLYLDTTELEGTLPSALGNLTELEFLILSDTQLNGALPLSLVNLTNLSYFHFLNTALCQPADAAFQTWLDGVENVYRPEASCQPQATPTGISPTDVPPTDIPPTATTMPEATATPVPTEPGTGATTGTGVCEGLIIDQDPHPLTPLSKPDYLEAVIDPAFGTSIRRITDIEASVTGEQAVIKPMYNTVQAWNADESYMILYQRSEGHMLYNGMSYEFIRNLDIRPADIEEVFWHFTDPDILFYVEPYYVNDENPGQQLIRYRVSSNTKEVVRSFSDVCTQDEGVVGGGDVQMMSWDSDVIGLRCVNEPASFFGYRISTDTLTPIVTSGAGNDYLPWYAPQPAPSGGLFLLDDDVLDGSFSAVRSLNVEGVEHSSLGRFANGNDGLFTVAFAEGPQGGCGAGALVAHDLTDGTCRTLVGQENGYPYPPSGTHMSALAHRNPGWVAVSMVGVANNGGADQMGQEVLDNELLLVDSAVGGEVCRVGHHRSYGRGGPMGYWAEPHVVISPSGTRLLFGSDWHGGSSVDSYVVELPTFDNTAPLPAPTNPTPENPAPQPQPNGLELFLPVVLH